MAIKVKENGPEAEAKRCKLLFLENPENTSPWHRMLARNADVDLVSGMLKGGIFMGRMVSAASDAGWAFWGYITGGK